MMSRRIRGVGGLLAAALWLGSSGCFYPADRGRALEAKVDRLEGENEAARRQIQELIPRIDEKIAQVTQALDSLDKASRRTDADTSVLLQKNMEDVAQLRGQLETQLHELQQLRDQLSKVQEDTERKMLSMMSPDAAKAYEARKKLEEIQRPEDPKSFLKLAQEKTREGDTAVARRLYDELSKKWPDYSGEAQFGIGEAWFKEDRCREALSAYGKVIQGYPKTPSAPQAFLRSSECFATLNMSAESRLALEELVKTHPRSSAAATARARLAQLDKEKKKSSKSKSRGGR